MSDSSKLLNPSISYIGDENASRKDLDMTREEPPPYEVHSSGSVLASSTTVLVDGTFDIEFSSTAPQELDELLPPLPPPTSELHPPESPKCPRLNIVIQVVGSRGDVQPFIALGTALQRYGHRIRLATHDIFADFVRKSGLEFYPIGGDPEDLMAYMVRNPGLLPSIESLKGGDILRKRRMIHEMLQGCWDSCIVPDPISHAPFVTNAIIANPPSFAHVHCGQALGVPVHIMFTMPWTATRAFPHPLANVKSQGVGESATNFLSYGAVDLMTWQGLGDVINEWRIKDLALEPVPASIGPDIATFLRIPHTYCWSPSLVGKPRDWGSNIDVCGFFMREEPTYSPPNELVDFLHEGSAPVYIGFGSIVLENAERMTNTILQACREAGVRAVISRGWSKLGGNSSNTHEVFYLGDCPHEWLFKQVAAVVHHGGAGTTACGLYNARPTVVVPFFGDGAGPSPIPHKALNAQNLAKAIKYCLTSEAREAARTISENMKRENGVKEAVHSFHRHLAVPELSCDLLPNQVAEWVYRPANSNLKIKLSNAAVKGLIAQKELKWLDLALFRPTEYHLDIQRWDPLTATASSTLGTITDFTSALGGVFVVPYRDYKRVRSAGQSGSSATLSATKAVGLGFQSMTGHITKGTLVDVPLAITEGFRNAPKLYGEEIIEHEKITDWKSGGAVAVKNFGVGFYEGITDLATKPYHGMKKEGTVGFVKGLGKGSLNMITKPGSAMFGLLAYPTQGIYKSMRAHKGNNIKTQIRDNKVAVLEQCDFAEVSTMWLVQAFRKVSEERRLSQKEYGSSG